MAGSQHEIYTIFCLIVGDNSPFPVEIAKNKTVGILKKMIKEEKHKTLANTEADQLKLYHVELPVKKLAENVAKLALESQSTLDDPTMPLEEAFPDGLKPRMVHILVSPPQASVKRTASTSPDDINEPHAKKGPRRSDPVAAIDGSTAQRSLTVDALYQRLNLYHFVLVRGTPASGKSTLAQLLEKHICTNEPEAKPIIISTWPRSSSWGSNLTEMYNPDGPNILIIDEAQLTYWDDSFWNGFLKTITPISGNRVILFASYGSPSGRPSVDGTPMIVPNRNRVSLRPVNHGDNIAPAGLFLMPDEFTDMVQKRFPMKRFQKGFLDYVFHVTAGHTGAVVDLLTFVLAHDSYDKLKDNNQEYTLEIFRGQVSMSELWEGLEAGSIFRRGLPSCDELQEKEIAQVFRAVLSNNHVTKKMLDEKGQHALTRCSEWGWLHATKNQVDVQYIFTTQLHQWFVEYYLGTQALDSIPITDESLIEFSIKVIRHFSRRKLSSPRNIGASSTQRPPEAQFQDEFYRCCHKYTRGSLVTFPEFGNGSGRIDFYIPTKNWGVELLRDGDRLESHSSRFTNPGAYAKMEFTDYIILDFRQTIPHKKHPGIPNLYHVVFEKDYKRAHIQRGSSLETVEKFELLN